MLKVMKGVILAGGFGTRLYPSTVATNKHLLPVHVFPMIEHPLYTIRESLDWRNNGEPEICIVTGAEHRDKFAHYFKTVHPGMKITFRHQEGAGGIAEALRLTEDFVGRDNVAVALGDNLLDESFPEAVRRFENNPNRGTTLFLKDVSGNDMTYVESSGKIRVKHGIAELSQDGSRVIGIEEKPYNPKTNLAVIGFYLYNGQTLFDIVRGIKPSARGELEITDVNNQYILRNQADFHKVDAFWSDMGSNENRNRCAEYAAVSNRDKRIFYSFPEIDRQTFPKDVSAFFN